MNAQRITLVVACLGILLAQLDTSVINLVTHRLHDAFHTDDATLRWFVDAYNVAYAAAILSAGGLGDRLGRRRIFVIGLAVFTVGSAACALAPNAATLVVARAFTGLGAALEVPATLALLSVAFPEGAARAKALGVWAAMNGLAFAIGPPLGGGLADAFGWRSVFAVAIPVALVALVLARRAAAPEPVPSRAFDVAGQLWAAAALGTLTFAAMAAGSREFATAAAWFAGALVCGVAFIVQERRAAEPLLDLTLFRDRPFDAATFCTACMTFGMYGLLYLTPLVLQAFRHFGTTLAGVMLLPLSAIFVVVSARSGAIVERLGTRATIAVGMACMGVGSITLGIDVGARLWTTALGLGIAGVGLGFTTGPLLGYAVARAPHERAGIASGVGNAARMLGATLGVAVLGGAFGHASAIDVTPIRIAYAGGGAIELLGALVAWFGIVEARAAVSPRPAALRRGAA